MFHFFSGSNQKKLWTPARIVTDLWFDPSDAATVTLNGSTISQINDKSGNDNHAAQSNSSNQPAYTVGGLNGKNVIQFSAARYLSFTSYTFKADTTFYGIMNRVSVGVNTFAFGSTGTSLVFPFWALVTGAMNVSYNDSAQLTFGNISTGTHIISTKREDADKTRLYVNGTESGTGQNNLALSGSINQMGRINTTTITHFLGELILLPVAHNLADRQKMEGYLAYKWGLQANLPTDHPYKNKPPYA
jgi:hypothetical protein